MVDAVESDLQNNDLTITKIGDKYVFSNKYGSVNGIIAENNVKISGDGVTAVSKTDLRKQYLNYIDQIQNMTKKIGTGSAETKVTNKDAEFSLKEYVVAGFVEEMRRGNTPAEKIAHVEKMLAKGIHVANDACFSGLYKNKGKYSAAYNPSTSQYIEFSFNEDNINGTTRAGGVVSGHCHLTKQELKQKYAPYRNDLARILQGLEYNKAHVTDYYKQYK